MLIKDIMKHIESFAPLGLALSWDNVGLLIGSPDWEVQKVYLSLDVTPDAVQKARENGCQLILSHHPIIFKPLKSITDPLYLELIQNKLAVISLHTNLDVAAYSVNHALADALGLEVLSLLSAENGAQNQHLVVYCPADYADGISEAAWQAGAGNIGNYHHCATRQEVQGSFCAGENAKPFVKATEGSFTKEIALEFMCDSFCLPAVLSAIRKAHPYETPAWYHFPVQNTNPAYGLGLVCKATQPLTLQQLGNIVKAKLNCPQLKTWTAGKDQDYEVQRIAICGGSGGSLINAATAQADVFISGDITYHTFLESGIPILDAGHFYTEYPVLRFLADKMSELKLSCQIMPMEEHEYMKGMKT